MTSVPKTGISILVLFGLLLVALLIVIIVLRSKGGRRVAIILLAVAVVLALLVLGVWDSQTPVTTVTSYRYPGRSQRPDHMIRPWAWSAGQAFLADVYPSEGAAAEALARQLAAELTAMPRKEASLWQVRISGTAAANSLQRAADALRDLEGIRGVEVAGAAERTAETDQLVATIRIDVTDRHRETPRGGTVRALLQAGERGASQTTKFVEKPWVEDFAEYLGREPQRGWVAMASDRPCTSHHEARQRAIEIAADHLADAVRTEIERTDRGAWSRMRGRYDPNWLQSRIQAELREGNLLADKFAQRFRRPYGDVYQHWVLVDASPLKLRGPTRRILAEIQTRREILVWKALSLAGVVGVILLVYLFLNAATRGYYLWSLRIAAAVLSLTAVAVLLLWA